MKFKVGPTVLYMYLNVRIILAWTNFRNAFSSILNKMAPKASDNQAKNWKLDEQWNPSRKNKYRFRKTDPSNDEVSKKCEVLENLIQRQIRKAKL